MILWGVCFSDFFDLAQYFQQAPFFENFYPQLILRGNSGFSFISPELFKLQIIGGKNAVNWNGITGKNEI